LRRRWILGGGAHGPRSTAERTHAEGDDVYYSMGFYPGLSAELAEAIGTIREKYDPTSGFIKPHVTVLFPVPGSVGEEPLVGQIGDVLSEWRPFKMRLGGFHKSRDHWLFLTLKEGEAEVRRLHGALYTGILAEYRRDDIEFVPHMGLGLFVKQGSIYKWDTPRESDLDRVGYGEALREAEALPLGSTSVIETFHLVKIPDGLIEWTTGKRAAIPGDIRITEVREFRLR
jgi:2'-5' RNA ligase